MIRGASLIIISVELAIMILQYDWSTGTSTAVICLIVVLWIEKERRSLAIIHHPLSLVAVVFVPCEQLEVHL